MSSDEPRTVYYVRSTLLGGAPIIEFVPAGWGTTENIYMGSQKLASHFSDSSHIAWRHVNPTTGSWLVSSQSLGGAVTFRSELDPIGIEMGSSDPYVSYTSYQDLMGLESIYEERGNPFDPGGGCGTVDGLPISCSEWRMRMQGGSVATETLTTKLESTQAPRLNERASPYIHVLNVDRHPITYHGVGLFIGAFPVIRGGPAASGNNNEGYYLDWDGRVITVPEDPTVESKDLEAYKGRIEEVLKNKECAAFIQELLLLARRLRAS